MATTKARANPRVVRSRVKKLIAWKFSNNYRLAAEQIDCSYWSLYRYLRANTAEDMRVLLAVADFFRMTMDDLTAPDLSKMKRPRLQDRGKTPVRW
jgi:hypothetical protein